MEPLGRGVLAEQPDGLYGSDRGVDLFAGVPPGGVLYRFGEDYPGPRVSPVFRASCSGVSSLCFLR